MNQSSDLSGGSLESLRAQATQAHSGNGSITVEDGNTAKCRVSFSWHIGQQHRLDFGSTADLSLTRRDIQHLSAHLPGFRLQPDDSDQPLATVKHIRTSSLPDIQQEVGEVQVMAPDKDIIPGTLPHLLYGACRVEWLRRQVFPVHAACIGDSRGCYLLAGPSGSGKTTLVLEHARQHRKHPNRKIFSGDKTLVRFADDGRLKAIAGTRILSVRHHDMPRWQSVIRAGAAKAEGSDKSVTRSGDRSHFQLTPDYYHSEPEVNIRGIALITLNDNYQLKTLTADSARHQLFPLFLDKQREDILIGDQDAVLDGSVPAHVKRYLAVKLRDYLGLASTETRQISGPLQEVYQSIMPGMPVERPLTPSGKKIVFGICGIGNGHLNRQLPCLNYLRDQHHQIIIFTYGQALAYFRGHPDDYPGISVCQVNNPYIPGCLTGLDFEATSRLSENNRADFNRVNFHAMAIADQQLGTPDLVISDYEQVSAQYAYSKQAPLITCDQQSKFLTGNFTPYLAGTTFRDEQERLSLFFPRAQQRLAVSFFRAPPETQAEHDRHSVNVKLLPPVIRPEIIAAKAMPGDTTDSLLMYITSQSWTRLPIQQWLDTLRKTVPDSITVHIFLPGNCQLPADCGHTRFYSHGDDRFDSLLAACRGVISTAGHTLLSEAMYLSKPVYAIPLENLYEQQINGKVIGDNQFGICSGELSAERLKTFIANLDSYAANIRRDNSILLRGNGKDQVIRMVEQTLMTSQPPAPDHEQYQECKFSIPELARLPDEIRNALLCGADHDDIVARGVVIQQYLAPTRNNLDYIAGFLTRHHIPMGSRHELEQWLKPGQTREIRIIHRYLKDSRNKISETRQISFGSGSGTGRKRIATPAQLNKPGSSALDDLLTRLLPECGNKVSKLHFEIVTRDDDNKAMTRADGSLQTLEIDLLTEPCDGEPQGALNTLFAFGETRQQTGDVEPGPLLEPLRGKAGGYLGKDLSNWERARVRNLALSGIPDELKTSSSAIAADNNRFTSQLFRQFSVWLPGRIASDFITPAPDTRLKTEKKILLNAEPFGFGPTAAIGEIFPHLREHARHLSYIGEKHTLNIQSKYAYNHIIDCTPSEQAPTTERKARYLKHLRQHDLLITACDLEVAGWAREAGLEVIIYDPLSWYWKEISPAITGADLYLAQNFLTVEQRLRENRDKLPETIVVPPLFSGLHRYQDKTSEANRTSRLLVNTGGLMNPLVNPATMMSYGKIIMQCIHKTLGSHYEQLNFLGSRTLAEATRDQFQVNTLKPDQVQDMLQQSTVALMTPGLGNILEAAALGKKTIWLPPANDSQGQQLTLLRQNHMVDSSIDWHDIFTDASPIDYFKKQEEVMKLIIHRIERLTTDPGATETLCRLITCAHQQLSVQDQSALSELDRRLSHGGGKVIADEILQWLKHQRQQQQHLMEKMQP